MVYMYSGSFGIYIFGEVFEIGRNHGCHGIIPIDFLAVSKTKQFNNTRMQAAGPRHNFFANLLGMILIIGAF
jgi:hypothetical protein